MIDNFIKNGWSIPPKNKTAQTEANEFCNIIDKSNRKLSQIETNDEKDYRNINLKDF